MVKKYLKEYFSRTATDVQKNIALIAATNRNLVSDNLSNSFRSDIYYRLSTVVIDLPPLRYRNDDVILIANHFLSKLSKKQAKNTRFHLTHVSAY